MVWHRHRFLCRTFIWLQRGGADRTSFFHYFPGKLGGCCNLMTCHILRILSSLGADSTSLNDSSAVSFSLVLCLRELGGELTAARSGWELSGSFHNISRVMTLRAVDALCFEPPVWSLLGIWTFELSLAALSLCSAPSGGALSYKWINQANFQVTPVKEM